MSILNNALDSIAIGLEDFKSGDNRRLISATRNIFSGILLLFKHRLCELSPVGSDEALIKQKILPKIDVTGEVNWIGSGTKTVDVQNIRDRFTSLGIAVDWNRLNKINKYRNDVEHYYSALNSESVQLLISNSFIIIRDFICDVLKEDPKLLLGAKYWKILVDVNEVYEKEKQWCDTSLERLDYLSTDILHALQGYRCSACGSDLLETTSDSDQASYAIFNCRACDAEYSYSDIAANAVKDFYEVEVYLSFKDGFEPPIVDCPYCFEDVYLVVDRLCVACENSAFHECERCGAEIPPTELSDENFCSYCSHVWDKVTSEYLKP